MSRTFELLERAQQDQDLFRVPATTSASSARAREIAGDGSVPGSATCAEEELLGLVQHLFLAPDGKAGGRPRRVVFCGIDDRSSASREFCARVGRTLAAQVESQVCVVDADLRVPAPSSLFTLRPDEPSEYSNKTTGMCLKRIRDNLWLGSRELESTCGSTPTPDQIRRLLKDLGSEFGHVIISAPQSALYNDAALLGEVSDGVVLVLEANATRRIVARNAQEALVAGNIRLLGIVLNNRTYPIPESIYRWL